MKYSGTFFAVILTTTLLLPVFMTDRAAAFMNLFSRHEKIQERDGVVKLDLAGLKPGEIKFYRLEKDGKYVHFFLVRDDSGMARMALDACEACYREEKGYTATKGGGSVTCVNCGQKFPLSRIGIVKGGCNPHPVPYQIEGNTMAIKSAALIDDGVRFFPGNTK